MAGFNTDDILNNSIVNATNTGGTVNNTTTVVQSDRTVEYDEEIAGTGDYSDEDASAGNISTAGYLNTLEQWERFIGKYDDEASTFSNMMPRYTFVHGMPFQFTPITDRRGNSGEDKYGRTFAHEIVQNVPIAVFTPCIPNFIDNPDGLSEEDGKSILEAAWDDGTDFESVFQSIAGKYTTKNSLNFFTAKPATAPYYEEVNGLCKMSARSMGIQNMEYANTGKRLDELDWGDYNADIDTYAMLFDVMGPQINSVSVAFDPSGSITDSISNSTRESSIAGMLKGLSSQSQELEFLLGAGMGVDANKVTTDITDSLQQFQIDSGNLNANSFFNVLPNVAKTVVSGSNIRFPEIWGDSSKGSDGTSISIRLISPYSDPFSKWRWVIVPFWHLFCLAAPNAFNPTSYSAPYLIKGYSKGYFNIEMGIIQSMSWRKFGDGSMRSSSDGMPMQIDIDLSIKDLYSAIGKTNLMNDPSAFFANAGLMELIGSLTGTNLSRLSINENIATGWDAQIERFFGAPGRYIERLSEEFENRFLNLNRGL